MIATAFLIPENSINYWIDRFKKGQIEYRGPYKRFNDEQVITLYDPDGLELELVAHTSAEDRKVNIWKEGLVPTENAIRGFYSVTLSEEGYERTASVLTDELGFIPHYMMGAASAMRFLLGRLQLSIKKKKRLVLAERELLMFYAYRIHNKPL